MIDIREEPAATSAPVAQPPAPPAGNPPAAAPQESTPTPEELTKRSEEIVTALWGKPTTPTPPPTPAPTPAPEAPDPAPAPAPPQAPAAQAAPASPTPEELIAKSADLIATKVAEAVKPPSPAPPAPPAEATFEMAPEDQRDLEAAQWLERDDPAKFAGAGQKQLDFIKANYAYQAEWEKTHPDQEFKADDPEHTEWYNQHPAPIPARQLDDAAVELKVHNRMEKMREPERIQQAIQTAAPIIAENIGRQIAAFVNAVDPRIADHYKGTDGKIEITEAGNAKFEAADPIAKSVLEELLTKELDPILLELEKTTIPHLNYRLKPRENSAHQIIVGAQTRAEKLMLAKPANEQIRDGKQFVTVAQMAKLRSESSDPAAIEGRYWTLTVDDVEAQLVQDYAQIARERIAKEDNRAKKKYGQAAAPAAQNGNPPVPPRPSESAPATGRSNPPSVSAGSDVVATPHSAEKSPPTFGEQVAGVLWKR